MADDARARAPEPTAPSPALLEASRDLLALVLLAIAIAVVYWVPPPPGMTLAAFDYDQLHSRRMEFARGALFGASPSLPAWYPRELLGTPFWSNVQSFPFFPSRLFLLLFDPHARHTYLLGVTLAAVLAGCCTYPFARRIGLDRLAAAVSGWTFACSGFFASRIAAGHLGFLEVYLALPLLLWAAEAYVQSTSRGAPARGRLVILGLGCGVVMLGGHPQLPVYALGATALYVGWRSGIRRAVRPWAAMTLGAGCAGFALVPMTLLIGRSTRVLDLAAAHNNIALPYGRLLTFWSPWRDGAPTPLALASSNPFHGYPSIAYFWDTVCYVGWAPWLALAFLLLPIRSKRAVLDARVRTFLIGAGVLGVLLALPLLQDVIRELPGTLLRSPSRLIYLTELALALALGVAVHRLRAWLPPRSAAVVVTLGLVAHGADLFAHARHYLVPIRDPIRPEQAQGLRPVFFGVGDQRVAISYMSTLDFNRQIDDVGFFDSIMLARTYRFLLRVANLDPRLNIQDLDGGRLPRRALQLCGVAAVHTTIPQPELASYPGMGKWAYRVPDPSPRAQFFAAGATRFVADAEMDRALRSDAALGNTLLLPLATAPAAAPPTEPIAAAPASVAYRRPGSDRIECTVTTAQAGYLRIIESWDPGWFATVDGQRTAVLPAFDALLCIELPPGSHEVVFE